MDLSVVIPVKNEAENIAALVGEVCATLDGLVEYEILYVDDGSTDTTVAEISRLAAKIPQIRLLRHTRNCGQSAAIRTGVRAARGGGGPFGTGQSSAAPQGEIEIRHF